MPIDPYSMAEKQIMRQLFHRYAPMSEIAARIGRSEHAVKNKINHLGWRRNKYVLSVMQWAPKHLRDQIGEMGATKFIEACFAFRDKERSEALNWPRVEQQERVTRIKQDCATIDADRRLSSRARLAAKRIAGMTLDAIATQQGSTRQAVAYATDPYGLGKIRESRRMKYLESKKIRDTERQRLILTDLLRLWVVSDYDTKRIFMKYTNLTDDPSCGSILPAATGSAISLPPSDSLRLSTELHGGISSKRTMCSPKMGSSSK